MKKHLVDLDNMEKAFYLMLDCGRSEEKKNIIRRFIDEVIDATITALLIVAIMFLVYYYFTR